MTIFNLYSKRQKKLRGEVPDIFIYNELPTTLRIQIVQIITEAFGEDNYLQEAAKKAYEGIHRIVCKEYGTFSLGEKGEKAKMALLNFILKNADIEKVLDIVELSFRFIDKKIREDYWYKSSTTRRLEPDAAINDLNARFIEHGIGYQFESREIIRVDSKYMHSEVVKPTLNLLNNRKFKGANQEYLKAHNHYCKGQNKECLSECLKSFESVLKIICEEKGWEFADNHTSKKLIGICFTNGLIPNYLQNQFNATIADNRITRYALNLTGSNIIFLIEQSEIS